MLKGEIRISQRFLHATLELLDGLLQFHGSQLLYNCLGFLAGRFLALLGMYPATRHISYPFYLQFGHNRENIALKMLAKTKYEFCFFQRKTASNSIFR